MSKWNFYKEKKTGDYVMARDKSRRPKRHNLIDVVGPIEDNRMDTIEFDMATQSFLKVDCVPVDESDVPEEWKTALRQAAGC